MTRCVICARDALRVCFVKAPEACVFTATVDLHKPAGAWPPMHELPPRKPYHTTFEVGSNPTINALLLLLLLLLLLVVLLPLLLLPLLLLPLLLHRQGFI